MGAIRSRTAPCTVCTGQCSGPGLGGRTFIGGENVHTLSKEVRGLLLGLGLGGRECTKVRELTAVVEWMCFSARIGTTL